MINHYISVDNVIFGFDAECLNVLLVERTLISKDNVFVIFSDLTLTGNHIYDNEDLDTAAYRVLKDLTGLENVFLEQLKSFGHPNRLKKPNDILWRECVGLNAIDRVVTIAYYSLLNSNNVQIKKNARNVKWYPVNEVTELAYDHKEIMDEALKALRHKIKNFPIAFELLPAKFTLTQLQTVYEIILGVVFDKRNFRRKIARMKYLIPLREKEKKVRHKPAQLYMFSREVYDATKNDFLDFTV